jgi:hypothetical protein
MSEFDGIAGTEGWSTKLRGLLDEAQEIARGGHLDQRIGISRRLTEFIVRSRPDTPEIEALDALAQATARALLLESIEGRLKALAGRTSEYGRLTKGIRAEARRNEEAADSLRFEGILGALASATTLIERLKRLKGALEHDGPEADIAALIDRTVAALETLFARIGKLV